MSYLDVIKERKDKASADKATRDGLIAVAKELKTPQKVVIDTSELKSVTEELKDMATYDAKASREDAETLRKGLESIVDAVNNIKIPELPKQRPIPAPIVNVPAQVAPVVNVPKADFSPITQAIEGLKEEKGIDLDCYRAHDLKDGDTQYIGFLNPEGDWYIIENDVKNNSLRYVFGHGGYTQAFSKAASYKYELLSEAINAL